MLNNVKLDHINETPWDHVLQFPNLQLLNKNQINYYKNKTNFGSFDFSVTTTSFN